MVEWYRGRGHANSEPTKKMSVVIYVRQSLVLYPAMICPATNIPRFCNRIIQFLLQRNGQKERTTDAHWKIGPSAQNKPES